MTLREVACVLVLTVSAFSRGTARQRCSPIGERVSRRHLGSRRRRVHRAGSIGAERPIRHGEIAVIDFAGDGSNFRRATNRTGDGPGLLVLRDGSSCQGVSTTSAARNPLQQSSFSAPRLLDATTCAYLLLASGRPRPPFATSTAGGPSGGSIRVPANRAGCRRVSRCSRGQPVTSRHDGRSPASARSERHRDAGRFERRQVRGAVAASELERRRPDRPRRQWRAVRHRRPEDIPGTGGRACSILTVNDDNKSDNSGEFEVQISTASPVPPPLDLEPRRSTALRPSAQRAPRTPKAELP